MVESGASQTVAVTKWSVPTPITAEKKLRREQRWNLPWQVLPLSGCIAMCRESKYIKYLDHANCLVAGLNGGLHRCVVIV